MSRIKYITRIFRILIVINLLFIVGVGLSSSLNKGLDQKENERRREKTGIFSRSIHSHGSRAIPLLKNKCVNDYCKSNNGSIFLIPKYKQQSINGISPGGLDSAELDSEVEFEIGLEDWMFDEHYFDNDKKD